MPFYSAIQCKSLCPKGGMEAAHTIFPGEAAAILSSGPEVTAAQAQARGKAVFASLDRASRLYDSALVQAQKHGALSK